MLSLRQIRRRIKSVENTKKVTHAMEMVSSSKLKRFQKMLGHSSQYVGELKRILSHVAEGLSGADHPILKKTAETKKILAVLIASDTGLCGSYNTNLFEKARKFVGEKKDLASVSFLAIGKHGERIANFLKQPVLKKYEVPRPQFIQDLTHDASAFVQNAFVQNEADEVYFIYTKAESLGSLYPVADRFLPLTEERKTPAVAAKHHEKNPVKYILEPNLKEILETLIPEFINAQIAAYFLNAMVSEQASRMMAMKQATENAKEVIDALTLQRNKARQAQITKEIIEVVSGSRALKGQE